MRQFFEKYIIQLRFPSSEYFIWFWQIYLFYLTSLFEGLNQCNSKFPIVNSEDCRIDVEIFFFDISVQKFIIIIIRFIDMGKKRQAPKTV